MNQLGVGLKVNGNSRPIWTPGQLGLDVWWDAADSSTITESGGSVSQWDDKSGNGNHLTQGVGSAQPTIGAGTAFSGKQVIKTTTAQYMGGGAFNLGTNSTIFLVYSQNNSARSYFLSLGADNHYVGTQTNDTDFAFIHGGTSFNHPDPGNPSVFTALNAPTDYELFFDGGSVFTSATEPNLYDGENNSFRFNTRTPGSAQFSADAEYAEVIYINRTLTTEERQKVEGYLAWKWGT